MSEIHTQYGDQRDYKQWDFKNTLPMLGALSGPLWLVINIIVFWLWHSRFPDGDIQLMPGWWGLIAVCNMTSWILFICFLPLLLLLIVCWENDPSPDEWPGFNC